MSPSRDLSSWVEEGGLLDCRQYQCVKGEKIMMSFNVITKERWLVIHSFVVLRTINQKGVIITVVIYT